MENRKTFERTSRKHAGRALFVLGLLLLLAAGAAQAQPNLNFKRVLLDWPTVELYFSAGCNGQPYFNLRPSDFRIFENGQEVKDFTLYCPDPTVRCPISVSLVFDASGSMMGSGNAGAKQAGHTFIDLMDGLIDEAALLYFTQVVTTQQQMTADRVLLHTATDALPASGATAVWDGAYAGVIELINNGRNQCRAVIVLTDGGDNSSTRTVAEIISLANRNRIRVYTVGLGSSINATELEMIALLTGGRYYQTPNAGQIAAIYTEIAYNMFQGFQECLISYQRDCANGTMRNVELQLRDVCGGSDTKVRTYRAPLDPRTTSSIPFHFEASDCISDEETVVRLFVDADTTMTLSPGSFFVHYNLSPLQFRSVSVPPGSPLQGQTISTSDVYNGTLVDIPGTWNISGPAPLLDFRFRAWLPSSQINQESIIISGSGLDLYAGCIIGDFTPAAFTIRRFAAKLNCALSIPAVVSPPGSQSYQPMPVPVTCEVSNDGNVISDSVDVTLLLPPGLAPAPGEMLKKRLQPSLLPVGAKGAVSWNVVFPLTQQQRHYHIEAVASQRGAYAASPCGDSLVVPPLDGLLLEARCSAPDSLTYDMNVRQYVPNPFDLRVMVWNRGVSAVRNATVRVNLPDGLELDPPSQPTMRSLAPSTLQPWNAGDPVPGVSWTVRWTRRNPFEERIRPRFVVEAEDMSGFVIDTISAGGEIRVPPARGSIAPVRLWTSGDPSLCEGDSLTLDAGPGFTSYSWSSGQDTRRIVVRQPGSYWCVVHSSEGWQDRSDTVTVVVWPLPATPVVTRQLDQLEAPAALHWQWERDGVLLAGDTLRVLFLPGTGSYRVRVANAFGCEAWSDPYDVTVLSTPDDAPAPDDGLITGFRFYPNPVSTTFSVDVSLRTAVAAELTLHDLLGREVRRQRHPAESRDLSTRFEVGDLRPGMYLLTLQADGERRSLPVLVEARR